MRSCGAVRFEDGCWKIKCEPHVLLRMKRVFGRVAKHAHGTVTLTDGDETARDLLWFLDRHPMTIADVDRKQLEKRAARHDLRRRNIEEVLSDGYEPPAFSLAVTARRYQRLAADMLLRSGGLLLADDVGLGKTASAICTFTDPRTLPALVVTLTHLPRQWELEIGKFAPSLRVHVIKRGTPYDLRDKQARFPDVVVVNYHKLSGWADSLAPHVKSIVFDEAQELRHDVSAKYAAARHVAETARYRMGLSATPIYNYGGEIFNVLDVLRPGALGVREEFVREWCGGNEAGSDRDRARIVEPRAFGTYAREQGLMLRRTRAEVGRELPALTKVPHHVDADPEALDRVGPNAAELARIILRQGEERRGQKMQASETLDAILRQATGIGKAPYVADFVRLLVESGERVLLYGWHREVYGIWQDRLRDLGPVMYTGSESSTQKDEARRKFVEGESPVMLMSLRAGAGLDGLQHCARTIVFGELDWSPGVHEQCLSIDTEVLTPAGWRGASDANRIDRVAGFDCSTGKIRWVNTKSRTLRDLGDGESMFAVRTEKIDVRVTGEHRMVVRRKTRRLDGTTRSSWEIALAQDLAGTARRSVPTCGEEDAPGVPLTDHELRFLGWFLTDGHFNGRFLTFFQAAHQPWNADLVEVLNGVGVTWHRYQRRTPKGGTMYLYCVPKGNVQRWSTNEIEELELLRARGLSFAEVGRALNRTTVAVRKRAKRVTTKAPPLQRTKRGWEDLAPYLDKNISPALDGISREQLRLLIRGLYMGDGAKSPKLKNVTRITSTNKVFLDRLQSLCVRRGFTATISERKSKTKAGRSAYDIWISDCPEASLPSPTKRNRLRISPAAPMEKVWCLGNELGTLVTRRNGKVTIVGNCVGRVHRDGQRGPVVAYFLIAEQGSDPVMADVLGLKKQQIDGLRDPYADVVERLDSGGANVKKLAEEYLRQRGIVDTDTQVA